MKINNSTERKHRGKQGGLGWSALFRILGTLMIALIIISSAPVAIPRVFGYEIFQIVSGSMEPAIPVGSAIYVKACDEEVLQTGDIIAFHVEDSVVAHRIIAMDNRERRLFTKGDANDAADMNPIQFEQIIGKVECVVPFIGSVMMLYATIWGKIYAFAFLSAGVLFQFLASKIGKENLKYKPETSKEPGTGESKTAKEALYQRVKCIGVLLIIAFGIVVSFIGYIIYRYVEEDRRYAKAESNYTKEIAIDMQENSGLVPDTCPIEVDFAALRSENPEVVGWIYCEDTPINYPICQGEDDEYYLTHAYDKKETKSGSIFLETENDSMFADANSILYGHHMKDGSMFATLADWSEQKYFEQHPCMWLLTPEEIYRVDLFSGYTTDATSDTYTVIRNYGEQMSAYLKQVVALSDFQTDINVSNLDSHFIVLSTCEYYYENARYVLHGKLVRVSQSS